MNGGHYIKWLAINTCPHNRYGTSSQVWIMLYRGSRDGFAARQFHEKCDEKGPTLTLVKVIICSSVLIG